MLGAARRSLRREGPRRSNTESRTRCARPIIIAIIYEAELGGMYTNFHLKGKQEAYDEIHALCVTRGVISTGVRAKDTEHLI